MDFIQTASKLFDSPSRMRDADIVGWCDLCEAEIHAADPVYADVDGEHVDGYHITSCRMHCPPCHIKERAFAATNVVAAMLGLEPVGNGLFSRPMQQLIEQQQDFPEDAARVLRENLWKLYD